MYANFELILEPMDPVEPGSPSQPYTNEVNQHTPYLVGVLTASLLMEMLIIRCEPIEAKIALKLFVITSKEKFVDCITCFPSYLWVL